MHETTTPLSSFERLLGRAATERERDQLRRVQAELRLRENDALWLVIFALQVTTRGSIGNFRRR